MNDPYPVFWLSVTHLPSTPANVSGLKPESLYYAHGFVGQEFRQSTAEMAWLCHMMSGASAGKTWMAESDPNSWRVQSSKGFSTHCIWHLGWDDSMTDLGSG